MENKFSPEFIAILHRIFFPRSLEVQREINERPRFVHYTSAETAVKMIKNREWWLRDPSCMNDFKEVYHGLQFIEQSLSLEPSRLKSALDKLYPNLTQEILNFLSITIITPTKNFYIGCISKHDPTENDHGRLSMWRAYGKGNGIAIVLNPDPVLNSSGILKLTTHKVVYEDHNDMAASMDAMADEILKFEKDLKILEKNELINILVSKFRELALITKHPGFKEEQEWRLLYDASFNPSIHMDKSVEIINGVAQVIYKAPLKSTKDGQKTGGELPELINRIIIGPTQYPKAMRDAFVELLSEAKVPDAQKKVVISGIPLRT